MTVHLHMGEQWIVRVAGKEYGPVDLETLTEWKREGRLLESNEIRRPSDAAWTTAGTLEDLFAQTSPLPTRDDHPLARRRTFAELMADSFRIYKSAFVPFFGATLLVTLPTLAFELTSPAYGVFRRGTSTSGLTPANIVALIAFTVLIVAWPIFLAAIQIATLGMLEGREVRLGEVLRRATNFFPRFGRLSIIVYGSYFFWTAIPVLAILSLVTASPTLPAIGLALILLVVQVMMVARLFVNFLFWQQSAIVSNLEGTAAIRESKTLARSRRRPSAMQRPLWRGALLASLWLLIALALSSGAELPIVLAKLQSVSTPEQLLAMWQNFNAPKSADVMLIASAVVSSLLHAVVRPFFGIAFVLLYFDARTDFRAEELAQEQ